MEYLVSSRRCRQDVDVISQLPDSILVYILSFLSTKDAIRTSILARRWKVLWTYLSDFNLKGMLKTGDCLVNQVDKILQKVEYIRRFRLEADGNPSNAKQVISWIYALLKYKVEELDLSFSLESIFVLANDLSAPESLNKLHLMFLYGFELPSFIHFPGLKTLSLSCATFSDETSLQQLFSGCPVLQKLTLSYCHWNIKNVCIKIPTLTALNIEDDYEEDEYVEGNLLPDCKITIDAVNLVSLSLTLNCRRLEYVLIKPTSLVKADINVWEDIDTAQAIKLLSGICHVQSLKIANRTLSMLFRAENLLSCLPTFHNLTHIHVDWGRGRCFSLKTLANILEKSPNLEVLDANAGFRFLSIFYWDKDAYTLNRVPDCFKYSLKSFSISYFEGSEAEMELLSFLLKNAALLERIEIFCSECISDLKMQAEISNHLQKISGGFDSCAIEFGSSYRKLWKDD